MSAAIAEIRAFLAPDHAGSLAEALEMLRQLEPTRAVRAAALYLESALYGSGNRRFGAVAALTYLLA